MTLTADRITTNIAARMTEGVKVYGRGAAEVRALDGVSVDFERGRFTAIMGPSGSGKSTLLHTIAGLDRLDTGTVHIGETDIGLLNDRRLTELRRDSVGFIFQAFNLIPTLSAEENILLPLSIAGRPADPGWFARVVGTVGLGDRLRHRPSELSGGQQQRVAAARALVSRPEIVFADEPSGNLDSHSGAELLGFMRQAVREFGQTIVMVTHDPIAAGYADRVVFIADGKIVDQMDDPTPDSVLDRMKTLGVEMFKTAIKGVAAHKLRLALTTLAIVLGVAFVSGTYVFTDSINARFDTLFSDVYAGIDVTVRTSDDTRATQAFDEALLASVEEVDGVSSAEASVSGSAQIIDGDGNPIGGQGPPTLGFSWIEDPALNILSISEENGRAPRGPGEVVIDAATAEGNGFAVGDSIGVETAAGTESFTLVGIANFGSEDNLAGATVAAFEFEEAQRLFDLEGKVSAIDVLADDGVAPQVLVERIDAAVPAGLEAVTGDQQTQENLDDVTEGLGFLNTALLAFAAVAVFVGAFIIQNTFRIIVGQRTRELALLRAVGATSRQVTVMVVLEAFVVAVVASALGVLAGIGVAEGVRTAMNAGGFGLPDGPLTVEPRTIVVGMSVGIIVTLAAAILPARKAAAVPPVAAMREEAASSTGRRPMRRRAIAGGLLATTGAVAIAVALLGEIDLAVQMVGAGALAVFLGVSTLAPLLAAPVAKVVASPFRGIVGRLARENTTRSPRRTASTASALMIGVALVAFVSVFAASIKSSVSETLQQAFPADLALLSTNLESGVAQGAIDDVSSMDGLATISAVRTDLFDVEGKERNVAGVDPNTIEAVYSFDPSIDIAAIGDGLLVQSDMLVEEGWSVGDTVAVEYPTATDQAEIVGTFEDQMFANFIVSREIFEREFGAGDADAVFIRLADGVGISEGEAAAEKALAGFPSIQINTLSEQIEQAEIQVDQLLALFTALLGLALIIAVLGIANTLALSIVERTREIGLLRAVGMSRRGIRGMVRTEAMIIAVFGALLGVTIGSGLGLAVVSTLADDGLGALTLPVTQLAGWVIAGGVAGVVAAILPARKAARLDVLEAISYE